MNSNKITFDKTAKKDILGIFDIDVDTEDYLIEKNNPSQRVLSPDGTEVQVEKFAGIKKGSLIVIKSDLPSLIEFIDRSK